MRFFQFLLPAALVLAAAPAPSLAQQITPKAPAAGVANAKTLLWEVSGKGLTQPSYVFGTMHLVCAADLRLSPAVEQALGRSKQVALELDLDDPQMAPQMQARMMLPAGQTLQSCLPPADYTAVSDYFTNELKMPFAQMSTIKPFVLMSLLLPRLMSCPVGSYEQKLMEAAKSRQQEVIGLETVAEQMSLFDNIPCAKQAQWLADLVTKRADNLADMQKLVALYQAQDVDALPGLMRNSRMSMAEYEASFLADRNRRWVPLIAQQAAAKPTFFAVGAAHLGGPTGVLALLRQQGYQVKPVL